MAPSWELTQTERDSVVQRAAHGITSMCYFGKHGEVSDDIALKAAQHAEKKAYTRARVEAETTTGERPRLETERAYLRILSQCILESAQNGCCDVDSGASTVAGDRLDLSQTGREFVTEELALELLAPLLASGAKISSVKLSTKSIGRDAAHVVARAFNNISSTLKVADISDIIAGRPEAEVLEALKIVTQALRACELEELNISDNALGEKGIRACEAALKSQKGLLALSLQNIGCSVNACKAVAELVASNALQKLHLFNNMSDNEGAASIAALLSRNANMKDFKMVSSRVGMVGGLALLDALSTGTSLQQLDISDNPMEPDLATGFKPLFAKQLQLIRINVNDICLQDKGVIELAKALADAAVCPKLETLELALNEITPEATPHLAAALASKKALRRLNLAENELECAGAVHIALGLQGCGALEELDLRTNQIGRVGAVAAAKCCSGKAQMQKLELDDNQISEEGVQSVTELLEAAFPGKDVLGSLDENDEENDPDDDDVLDTATEQVAGLKELDLDLGNLTL